MISTLREKLLSAYYSAIQSIWLYPTVISLVYFIVAIALLSIQLNVIADPLVKTFPWLIFDSIDTPRSILTTLLAGILSLMVLSFSMVMVVLSQAASNFSPKILLGLVSEKDHQLVLGHYLGTIIYSMVLLSTFRQSENNYLPSIGVFIAIVLGVWCLGLFVFFIHNISQSIQINVIIERIYHKTHKKLSEQLKATEKHTHNPAEIQTHGTGSFIFSAQSGYIQNFDHNELIQLAEKRQCFISLLFTKGEYVLENYPIAKVYGTLDEDQLKKLQSDFKNHLRYYDGEDINENYFYGFTQLMEIAIKALSPAINDPGTARLCIHYLTDMFRLKMQLNKEAYYFDEKGQVLLTVPYHTFAKLLYQSFTPIRQYGKEDISICLALLESLNTLAYFDKNAKHQETIQGHCDAVSTCLNQLTISEADVKFTQAKVNDLKNILHQNHKI